MALLPAETPYLGDGHSLHTHLTQRITHIIKLKRLYDRYYHFHHGTSFPSIYTDCIALPSVSQAPLSGSSERSLICDRKFAGMMLQLEVKPTKRANLEVNCLQALLTIAKVIKKHSVQTGNPDNPGNTSKVIGRRTENWAYREFTVGDVSGLSHP
jgi:hypothetical protein